MRPPPPTWVRLAGVLLEVGALDADARAVGQLEPAVDVDRLVVLARSGSPSACRDRSSSSGGRSTAATVQLQRLADAHGQLDRLLVEHRQRPGQAEAHRARCWCWARRRTRLGQPQNSLVAVASSACTSRPMTSSQPSAASVGASSAHLRRCLSSTRGGPEHRRSPSAGASTCTPTGRPSSPVPNGTRHRRVAGQVRRDRAHVAQVHRQRVGGLGAERERDGRRRRRRAARRTARRRASKSRMISVRTCCALP